MFFLDRAAAPRIWLARAHALIACARPLYAGRELEFGQLTVGYRSESNLGLICLDA